MNVLYWNGFTHIPGWEPKGWRAGAKGRHLHLLKHASSILHPQHVRMGCTVRYSAVVYRSGLWTDVPACCRYCPALLQQEESIGHRHLSNWLQLLHFPHATSQPVACPRSWVERRLHDHIGHLFERRAPWRPLATAAPKARPPTDANTLPFQLNIWTHEHLLQEVQQSVQETVFECLQLCTVQEPNVYALWSCNIFLQHGIHRLLHALCE